MTDERPRVLLGPTASGKTAVSLPLAERLQAEIVSVDSRQIFRGMEIGSAAPTPLERKRVPHHLVGEMDPREGMSAGAFGRKARRTMDAIRTRGKVPLLVGGSGLYLRAALGGLSTRIPGDPATRERLRARLRLEGAAALHAELVARDPVAARTISPRDTQRITRALEILEVTGELPSRLRTEGRLAETHASIVVLDREREDLMTRIRSRVSEMIAGGLAEEVKQLLAAGLDPSSPVLRSVGYAETIRFLEGELTPEEWVESVVVNTRRLVKRQRTWFRGLSGAHWIQLAPGETPEAAAARVHRAFRGPRA